MHFAGIYFRDPLDGARWSEKLNALASRDISGAYESYALGNSVIVADTRLTRRSLDDNGLLVNTGNLIPDSAHSVSDARADLARLARYLTGCRGNYAGVLVPRFSDRLVLFSDFLGVHPIYYADVKDVFVFSTSLTALRRLIPTHLQLDQAGLLATAAVGFAFGERTPYQNVHCIDAAQVIVVDRSGVQKQPYWDWRTKDIEPVRDLDALADEVHQEFVAAVRLRYQADSPSLTLLSGGMDSRSILATQVALGNRPRSMCISHSTSLDAELARRVAAALNCRLDLHEIPFAAFSAVGGVGAAVHDIIALAQHSESNVTHVWSGDGGSVGLGAVYLSARTVSSANDESALQWIEGFLAENSLVDPSSKLFAVATGSVGFLRRAIQEEVDGYNCLRRGQIPYRFLMLNDQRRHLHYLFEMSMRVPIEFVTPFWDSRFLRAVLQCPETDLLQHRFYSRFFERLLPAARTVPWQTYPEHVPCPIPIPEGYEYQWAQYRHRRGDIDNLRSGALRLLRACASRSFPIETLRRSTAAVVAALILLRRDYTISYLLRQAETVLDFTLPLTTGSNQSTNRSATAYLGANSPYLSE